MTWLDELAERARGNLDDRVRDALMGRGVTEAQIATYRLGYLDGALPTDIDIPVPFRARYLGGQKLRDSYVFPLTNTLGQVTGFQFRSVERGEKRYSDYFGDDGKTLVEAGLFGLGEAMAHAWEHGELFVVEGPFDLFPIQRFFPGVVATLTARVVEPLLPVLRRMVRVVWLGFDMDTTGRKGCSMFTKEHGKDFTCNEVVYPKATFYDGRISKDPGDLWEAWGDEGVGRFIRSLGTAQRET